MGFRLGPEDWIYLGMLLRSSSFLLRCIPAVLSVGILTNGPPPNRGKPAWSRSPQPRGLRFYFATWSCSLSCGLGNIEGLILTMVIFIHMDCSGLLHSHVAGMSLSSLYSLALEEGQPVTAIHYLLISYHIWLMWFFSLTTEKCCFEGLDTFFFLWRRKAVLEHFKNVSLHSGCLLPASVCANPSYHLL